MSARYRVYYFSTGEPVYFRYEELIHGWWCIHGAWALSDAPEPPWGYKDVQKDEIPERYLAYE